MGKLPELSRRERQIMDIVYEREAVSAAEVREQLSDAPSYSTVRALLRVLVDKGHLRHRQEGPRYIYEAVLPREAAGTSAMRRLVRTFFDGSAENTVAALIDMSSADLSNDELDRLARLIDDARRKGR